MCNKEANKWLGMGLRCSRGVWLSFNPKPMEVLAWGGGGGAPGSVHPAGGMSRAPYEAVGPDEMWLF